MSASGRCAPNVIHSSHSCETITFELESVHKILWASNVLTHENTNSHTRASVQKHTCLHARTNTRKHARVPVVSVNDSRAEKSVPDHYLYYSSAWMCMCAAFCVCIECFYSLGFATLFYSRAQMLTEEGMKDMNENKHARPLERRDGSAFAVHVLFSCVLRSHGLVRMWVCAIRECCKLLVINWFHFSWAISASSTSSNELSSRSLLTNLNHTIAFQLVCLWLDSVCRNGIVREWYWCIYQPR